MRRPFAPATLLEPQFRAAHVLLVGLALLAVILVRIQPRLIIRNESDQAIVHLDVVFFQGDPEAKNHHVIFEDIPSKETQWQGFDSKWGKRDSDRFVQFQGTFADGRRIKGSSSLMLEELPGERLGFVVHSGGSVDLE